MRSDLWPIALAWSKRIIMPSAIGFLLGETGTHLQSSSPGSPPSPCQRKDGDRELFGLRREILNTNASVFGHVTDRSMRQLPIYVGYPAEAR